MAEEVTTNGAVVEASEKHKANVVVSWTGGKDGCLAIYKAISEGFNVSYLLHFRDTKQHAQHNLNRDLLDAQAQAMGIPIIQRDFVSYEAEFKTVVRTLNQNGEGIEGAVFGHIGTHEYLVQRMCRDLNIAVIMPLWNRDSGQIITDFINAGFEAIVVSTNVNLLGKEWLGRTIDSEFVAQLRAFNSTIDVCGEFGEFHTLVLDGSLFKNRIRIIESERILEDGYWRLDIVEYAVEEKE